MLSVMLMLFYTFNTLDQSQKDNLREPITIALEIEQQRLNDLLHECSYWNDAYQNLIVNPDQKWVDAALYIAKSSGGNLCYTAA